MPRGGEQDPAGEARNRTLKTCVSLVRVRYGTTLWRLPPDARSRAVMIGVIRFIVFPCKQLDSLPRLPMAEDGRLFQGMDLEGVLAGQ